MKAPYKLPKLYDANGDIELRWYVFYSFIISDSSAYKRFKIYIPFYIKNKTERYILAKKMIEDLSLKLIQGFNPFKSEITHIPTITQAIDTVLAFRKNTVRKRTYHTESSIIGIFKFFIIRNGLQNKKINEIDIYIAQAFLDYRKSKKISNRTYNNNLTTLKSFFSILLEREYIKTNPFKNIKKLDQEESIIIAFNHNELAIINESLPIESPQLYLIMQLVFYCFLRPAEIVRIKIWQIDLIKGIITMPGSETKNKKQSIISIPVQLMKSLKDYNLNFSPQWYLVSKGLIPGTKEIAPNRIAEAWSRFRKKYNIANYKGIYSMKHTGAGMCVDAGLNVRDIQLHLRHASLDQTQVYLERFRSVTSAQIVNHFPSL